MMYIESTEMEMQMPENGDKKNGSRSGSQPDPASRNDCSEGSPAVDSQHTLEQWRKQVIDDHELASLESLILLAISYEDIDTSGEHWLAMPINSRIWNKLNISDTAYYNHLKRAIADKYLEHAGYFTYDTGHREATGKTYKLTFGC